MSLFTASDNVADFHRAFGLPVTDKARVLEGDELELRKTLIREEYEELMEALDGDDLAAQMKEASDLIYVILGWDLHAGQRLPLVFGAVHASNMGKLWDCEAAGCVGGWTETNDVCGECNGVGGYVKYREDGKVLKPPTYSPPNVERYLSNDYP